MTGFTSMQRALRAKEDAGRLKKHVSRLQEQNDTQAHTIEQLATQSLVALRAQQRTEQNGLCMIAALVRAAGGTVRVPEVFLADRTGNLHNEVDELKHVPVISWSPELPGTGVLPGSGNEAIQRTDPDETGNPVG